MSTQFRYFAVLLVFAMELVACVGGGAVQTESSSVTPNSDPAVVGQTNKNPPSSTSNVAVEVQSESYVKNCIEQNGVHNTSPYTYDGEFKALCLPDTLYAWMEPKFIQAKANQSSPEEVLPTHGKMFLWRTPVGSYGYGMESIRVKLKEDVLFAHIKMFPSDERNCEELAKKYNLGRTVFVVQGVVTYHEYMLCESGPVHSWSYGTERHFQEMVSERDFIEKAKAMDGFDPVHPPYDPLHKSIDGNTYADASGKVILYHIFGDTPGYYDTHTYSFDDPSRDRSKAPTPIAWSFEELQKRIAHQQASLEQGEHGKVFFPKDVNPSLEDHYSTKVKTYW